MRTKKPKNGMLDHEKDEVKRIQIYTRMYKREEEAMNEHLKLVKEKLNINKSEWIRKAILKRIVTEKGLYKK